MINQSRIPLEYFLSLKNEHDAIATVRTVGVVGAVVATLAGGFFVVSNAGLGAACFIGTGVGAVAGSYKQKRYLELTEMLTNVETYEVESRQDLVVSHLGGGMVNQTPLSKSVTVEPLPALTEPPISSITPVSLGELNFHHLMILAPTGWGKSTVAHYILDHLNGDQIIVDPHATPKTWGGLPVAGQGRNYEEIKTFFELSLKEMNDRYQRRNKGDTNYSKLYILLDEFPAIAKAIGGDEFKEWVQVMLCEARKVKISLIMLSQGKSVKTLGLEGQSELLENLTIIRGKGFAKSHARSLKDESLQDWLAEQERPATIDDDRLIVPDLSSYKPLLNTIPTDESLKLLGNHDDQQNQFFEKPRTLAETSFDAIEPTEPVEPVVNDWTEITPKQQAELLNRISLGQSQNKIMEEFFKVRKGGSIRYRNAKKIYDEVKDSENTQQLGETNND